MTEDNAKILNEINSKLGKLTSYKHNFFRGLVNGMATILGATILGTLALGLLSSAYDSVEDVPFLGPLLEETTLEETINNANN